MKSFNRCCVRNLRAFSSAGKDLKSKMEQVPSMKDFMKTNTQHDMEAGLEVEMGGDHLQKYFENQV